MSNIIATSKHGREVRAWLDDEVLAVSIGGQPNATFDNSDDLIKGLAPFAKTVQISESTGRISRAMSILEKAGSPMISIDAMADWAATEIQSQRQRADEAEAAGAELTGRMRQATIARSEAEQENARLREQVSELEASTRTDREVYEIMKSIAINLRLDHTRDPQVVMADIRRSVAGAITNERDKLRFAIHGMQDQDIDCICGHMEAAEETCLLHGRSKSAWMDIANAAQERLNEMAEKQAVIDSGAIRVKSAVGVTAQEASPEERQRLIDQNAMMLVQIRDMRKALDLAVELREAQNAAYAARLAEDEANRALQIAAKSWKDQRADYNAKEAAFEAALAEVTPAKADPF